MIDKQTWGKATELVKSEVVNSSNNDTFRNFVIDTLDIGFNTLYNVLKAIEDYQK